jgi:hypothetical protein
MLWKETLYERRLKRSIDDHIRAAINSEFHRRRDQILYPRICSGAVPSLSWSFARSESPLSFTSLKNAW